MGCSGIVCLVQWLTYWNIKSERVREREGGGWERKSERVRNT